MRSFTTSVVVVHPTTPRLLCILHPSLDVWMFPGGHVEPDENPHEAAKREVREEVGLEISLIDLSGLPVWSGDGNRRLPQPVAMIEETLRDGGGRYVDFVYAAFAKSEEISMQREITCAGWFDRDRLARLETSYPIKEVANSLFDRLSGLRS